MHVHPFTIDQQEKWNAFARRSPDAWFWHTTAWMDFVLEMGAERSITNLSFSLMEGPKVLCICPVFAEEVDGTRRFSYLRDFLTTPAFAPDVPETVRENLWKVWVDEVRSLAQAHDVEYLRLMHPALAPSRLSAALPVVDPLLRLGFMELPAATQIIDLRLPTEVLWQSVRKGHKSDVKRGEAACGFAVWDATNITVEKFKDYQELHRRDAGRVTRSQRSFDIMREWVQRDHAVLVEATHAGQPASFALILLFEAGAYYGSSCKDPDLVKIPSSHVLQWRTILWLKARGIQHYDIGMQVLGEQWHETPSAKQSSIAGFKRGFGGRTMRAQMAEQFFSRELRDRCMRERLERLLALPDDTGR